MQLRPLKLSNAPQTEMSNNLQAPFPQCAGIQLYRRATRRLMYAPQYLAATMHNGRRTPATCGFKKQAFTAVGLFRLCRLLFSSKATIPNDLSPFLKKLLELTALKMLPGSSDAHPSIMIYERRAAVLDLSLRAPEH